MRKRVEKEKIDALIVGAGFSGMVMAERLSSQLGWKCVIIDERDHIGGNAYDYYDEFGVLIHKYGPHYFRTNSRMIVDYLSKFTDWHNVEYVIKSYTDEQYWDFPINLNTFEQFIGRKSNTEEFKTWLERHKAKISAPQNSEEAVVSKVGKELFDKFYKDYTYKQWGLYPHDLDKSVCMRVPIRTNRDDRYLNESFQAMPANGYTAMFEKMLHESPDAELRLSTGLKDAKKMYKYRHMVYTGSVDAYFNYCYGKLPYRSLVFEHESFDPEMLSHRETISGKKGFWQPAVQINYPSSEEKFTRIVELKHVTGQTVDASTIIREYPADYEQTGEPFYPLPTVEAKACYEKYKQLTKQEEATSFIGRLGTYRYYNMDQVVAMTLTEFEKIKKVQSPDC